MLSVFQQLDLSKKMEMFRMVKLKNKNKNKTLFQLNQCPQCSDLAHCNNFD